MASQSELPFRWNYFSETEFKFHIELEQKGKDISFLVDDALEIWKPCTLDLTDVDNWFILHNGTLLCMSEG